MSSFECFCVTLMLRCNLAKSDESTFFILNPKCRLGFCPKLGIAVHKWKYKLLSWVDPHAIYSLFSVFPWYIKFKLNKFVNYNKYQLTKCWLEGKLYGSSEFLKKMWLIEYRIQLTSDNLNLQGKLKKVWVIGSSSYRDFEANNRK